MAQGIFVSVADDQEGKNPKIVTKFDPLPTGPSEIGADAFGRVRVSQPTSIWDNKNIHDRRTNHWQEVTAGGGTISFNANESSVELDVGTTNGDRVVRQTLRYFAYVPGRSQSITMTGVMESGKDNLWQGLGYFDDKNGLFFEQDGSILGVTTRTFTSGSAVDNTIPQSEWNLDRLDPQLGNNPSGITLDITKAQIFVIDFQWLGVGRVRFGFNIDGKAIYVHEVLNANSEDKVYMSTPSLPIRYEIRNDGTTGSASQLKEICNSVDSEGGYQLPGYQYSCSNGILERSISARTPILAFRARTSINGKDNRRTARILRIDFVNSGNANILLEVVHLHSPITDVGGSWSTTGIGGSGMEYNAGLTALSSSAAEHVIIPRYAPSGQGSFSTESHVSPEFVSEHNFITQNFDSTDSQVFAVFATPFSGTQGVAATIEWIEFD